MYLRTLLASLVVLPSVSSLHAGVMDGITGFFSGNSKQTPPTMRVLVVHDVPKANIEVRGEYSLYDPKTGQFIDKRFTGKNRDIEGLDDGLKWGEAFPGRYQLEFRPSNDKTVILLDGKEYKGRLLVYDIGKTISIVDQVSVEDYVRGVLSQYNDDQLEPEALAALAIAIRTNTYYQIDHPKTKFWTVDAKKVGFRGVEEASPEIKEAARVTRNMILSKTGIYEGKATPIPSQFASKDVALTREAEGATISLEEANKMARAGDHAAKILGKAFPGSTIMLLDFPN